MNYGNFGPMVDRAQIMFAVHKAWCSERYPLQIILYKLSTSVRFRIHSFQQEMTRSFHWTIVVIFYANFIQLCGENQDIFSIQETMHICEDVRVHRPLGRFSSFFYEKCLQNSRSASRVEIWLWDGSPQRPACKRRSNIGIGLWHILWADVVQKKRYSR